MFAVTRYILAINYGAVVLSFIDTKVKFTCAKTMSASRVENSDDMAVDDSGVAPPTAEWLQAAQRAAETDGILENTSAKRQKVCKSCHTLTGLWGRPDACS